MGRTVAKEARKIAAEITAATRQPVIRIKTAGAKAPLPVTASKFGGAPYLPAGAQSPTNESGKPLGMIAQINCAELPKMSFIPRPGYFSSGLIPAKKKAMKTGASTPMI